MNRALLEEVLYALEYASDMTKPEGLSGCDCPICTVIPKVKAELASLSKPYAWRNPMNGVVIDDRKKHSMGVGNGYPNFSEPLYGAGCGPSREEDQASW